jgi:uncharacterized protein (DUF2147 family)
VKRYLTLAAILTLVLVKPASAGDGDAILGLWATDPEGGGGEAHVEIYADGDQYSGRIVWLAEPVYPADDEEGMAGQEKVDRENPDEALRNKPIVGLVIVKGFKFDGKDTWRKGTIYDPDNGKTYKSKMKLESPDVLKVRGFIGISLIGRTTEWTRVKDGG